MRFRNARLAALYLRTALIEHPRIRLAKLTVDLWVSDGAFSSLMKADPSRRSSRDVEEDFYFERRLVTDEIDAVRSRMLVRKAERLDVDVHVTSADWERSEVIGTLALTDGKSRELRKAVRAAEAERWVVREARLKTIGTLVTSVAGLVGALIGLYAISHK